MIEHPDTVKEKLVQVVLSLARRSIDEARKVPYVVEQDNVVDILINHPDLYRQLVSEGQIEGEGVPQGKMLVKLDILAEIEEFRSLDQFLSDPGNSSHQKVELDSVSAQINTLTKLFMAYHSNMVAIFEREYDHFLERYKKTLAWTEEKLPSISLNAKDLEGIRRTAEGYLAAQRYVEAFSLGELIHPEIVKDLLFQFSEAGYSLVEELIRGSPKIVTDYSGLVRFILRASYLSHNLWCDLFSGLMKLSEQDPQLYQRDLVLDLIEQDFVFCCNLLHIPYDEFCALRDAERSDAVRIRLNARFPET